jgi:hypothetical protein
MRYIIFDEPAFLPKSRRLDIDYGFFRTILIYTSNCTCKSMESRKISEPKLEYRWIFVPISLRYLLFDEIKIADFHYN